MPGFKVHITASTALGIGYGVGAATLYDVPIPTAALATTLCSVAGMLPDLDSGPGRPLHESVSVSHAATIADDDDGSIQPFGLDPRIDDPCRRRDLSVRAVRHRTHA